MVRAAEERHTPANGAVAAQLDEAADLLARQGANEFRIRAYRREAECATWYERTT